MPAINLVQSTLGPGNNGNANAVLNGVTSGNLIVVAVSVYKGTLTLTDDRENVYTKAVEVPVSGNDRIAIYYAQNITGGAIQLHAHTTSSNSDVTIVAHEYSGTLANRVLDVSQAAMAITASTAVNSGNTSTTTQANELVLERLALVIQRLQRVQPEMGLYYANLKVITLTFKHCSQKTK